MKVVDLLSIETIKLNIDVNSKNELIDEMVNIICKSGNITSKEIFRKEIYNREEVSTTGIGEGIAIPHAKSEVVKKATIAIGLLNNNIDYKSIDNVNVNVVFMLAAPKKNNEHVEILSKISSFLMDDQFVNDIRTAKTKKEIIAIINKKDIGNEYTQTEGKYKVLAVTSCPTGIAHTYMAEEALYKAGAKLGVSIKVETNGSSGIKNKLTKEEIELCDAIIVAADTKVETDRFNGRKVLFVNTGKAIKESEEIINKVLTEDIPIYKNNNNSFEEEVSHSKENVFRQIYKHLMNGVSHMLPFVIGGGILIALAFLIDSKNAGSPDFGSVNQVAKIFKTIGGYAFNFMLPVLAAYIASSIADRPGLAVGFVGGFMATLPNASFIQTQDNASAGFLGALVAGFVGGYIILGLKFATKKLPKSLDGVKPTLIYPVFGILLMGLIMYFIVNAPFAYLNNVITKGLNSLNDVSIVLLGTILAAMMSIDMGGPINKAAYVFGTAAITSGNYAIMAPVMIGGMAPPLVIALASTFFPQKFTKKERENGKVNYIMGLSFITEGAIPFAASDPWRVILSCSIGAGIAGGLCSLFGCELMAPHGGIFVLAVITNPMYYFISLVIGSVIGMFLLGVLKKKVDNPELGSFKGILNKEK